MGLYFKARVSNCHTSPKLKTWFKPRANFQRYLLKKEKKNKCNITNDANRNANNFFPVIFYVVIKKNIPFRKTHHSSHCALQLFHYSLEMFKTKPSQKIPSFDLREEKTQQK